MSRFFAWVDESGVQPRTQHCVGVPPGPGEIDSRVPMPMTRVVLTLEGTDGWFLERFAADGTFAGDTWHQDEEAARRQADFEYSDRLGHWRPAPADVDENEIVTCLLDAGPPLRS